MGSLDFIFSVLFSPQIIGSFLLGVFGVLIVLWVFPRIGLLDFPHRYGMERKAIAYPAGLSLVLMFFLGLLLFFPFESKTLIPLCGFLLGLLLLVVVSFIDDRVQISPVIRLMVQSISACMVIFSGTVISFVTNPFSVQAFELPFFIGASLTFIWIIGFINATNWLDGIPNLTLSSGCMASMSLGALSLSSGVNQPQFALMCFIFGIIMIPFIVVNITKTRFILGDTGAMSIGFCLAVFSLFAGGKMATVLIVMSIPIFDSIFVFITRLLQNKSPLKGGDRLHFHDFLIDMNWKEWHVFVLYFSSSVVLGVSVLFLETLGKLFLLASVFLFFITVRTLLLRSVPFEKISSSD